MTAQSIFADLLQPARAIAGFSPATTEEKQGQPTTTAEIWVIAWTPSGAPMRVKAKNAAHADWLIRMNPKPETIAAIHVEPRESRSILPSAKVRCTDCQNAIETEHELLYRCGKGRQAPGGCGYFWGLDVIFCDEFEKEGQQ